MSNTFFCNTFNATDSEYNSKNEKILIGTISILILAIGMWFYSENNHSSDTGKSEVIIHKNSGCQCCTNWAQHLQENDFTVSEKPTNKLHAIKRKQDIPHNLQSCHTAIVDDYVVEGHVPAEDIQRMLEELPDIRGIGVGGMPIGSPGMEGSNPEPYTVYSFDEKGNQSVWARHQQDITP